MNPKMAITSKVTEPLWGTNTDLPTTTATDPTGYMSVQTASAKQADFHDETTNSSAHLHSEVGPIIGIAVAVTFVIVVIVVLVVWGVLTKRCFDQDSTNSTNIKEIRRLMKPGKPRHSRDLSWEDTCDTAADVIVRRILSIRQQNGRIKRPVPSDQCRWLNEDWRSAYSQQYKRVVVLEFFSRDVFQIEIEEDGGLDAPLSYAYVGSETTTTVSGVVKCPDQLLCSVFNDDRRAGIRIPGNQSRHITEA